MDKFSLALEDLRSNYFEIYTSIPRNIKIKIKIHDCKLVEFINNFIKVG